MKFHLDKGALLGGAISEIIASYPATDRQQRLSFFTGLLSHLAGQAAAEFGADETIQLLKIVEAVVRSAQDKGHFSASPLFPEQNREAIRDDALDAKVHMIRAHLSITAERAAREVIRKAMEEQ
jgi:hypothetical protein